MNSERIRSLNPGMFLSLLPAGCGYCLYKCVKGYESHIFGIHSYNDWDHKESLLGTYVDINHLLVIANIKNKSNTGRLIIFLTGNLQIGYIFVSNDPRHRVDNSRLEILALK